LHHIGHELQSQQRIYKLTEHPKFNFKKEANRKLQHSVLNIIANIQYVSELTKQVIQTNLFVLFSAPILGVLGNKIM
jgi:hypothetical protein